MSKITEVANLLEDKFEKILESFSFLKDENEYLNQRITVLEADLTERTLQLSEKEESFKLLQIAKTIEGSKESTRETKLKINALIREIDLCIVQLSE